LPGGKRTDQPGRRKSFKKSLVWYRGGGGVLLMGDAADQVIERLNRKRKRVDGGRLFEKIRKKGVEKKFWNNASGDREKNGKGDEIYRKGEKRKNRQKDHIGKRRPNQREKGPEEGGLQGLNAALKEIWGGGGP